MGSGQGHSLGTKKKTAGQAALSCRLASARCRDRCSVKATDSPSLGRVEPKMCRHSLHHVIRCGAHVIVHLSPHLIAEELSLIKCSLVPSPSEGGPQALP